MARAKEGRRLSASGPFGGTDPALSPAFVNAYAGWAGEGDVSPGGAGGAAPGVPFLDPAKTGAVEFWREAVRPRRPAVLTGWPTDASWKAGERWSDEYLTRRAGDAAVEVEVREGTGEGYGRGRKESSTFGEVLGRLAAGSERLYLTTQEVPAGPDGHPEPFAEPISTLRDDLPLVPAILGRLALQSINLWVGRAVSGSSSGLHHDFHDNLYVLLRGRKRFRLFPPSDAGRMSLVGQVAGVHPNGRVVYRGPGDGDGACAEEGRSKTGKRRGARGDEGRRAAPGAAAGTPTSLRTLDTRADGASRAEAERWLRLRAAELAVAEAREAGDRGALARAEEALDDILEGDLDGALSGRDPFDDFDNLDGEAPGSAAPARANSGGREDPPSFSRVRVGAGAAELARDHPSFPGWDRAIEVTLEAGQCLFLPAGWFHEVSSFSTDSEPCHMALNYWVHPPDNLTPEGFRQPYLSPYWPLVWESRRARYETLDSNPAEAVPGGPVAPAAATPAAAAPAAAASAAAASTASAGKAEDEGPSQLPRLERFRRREEETPDLPAPPRLERFRRRRPPEPEKAPAIGRAPLGIFGYGRRRFLHLHVLVHPTKRSGST